MDQRRFAALPSYGCPDGEFVNLNACFSPNDFVCAYAATTLVSDSERTVTFLMGSDDGIAVWVNGENVLSHDILRGVTKDQEKTEVTLKKGENTVLIKITESIGGWGFYFRIVDPETGQPPAGVTFKH